MLECILCCNIENLEEDAEIHTCTQNLIKFNIINRTTRQSSVMMIYGPNPVSLSKY